MGKEPEELRREIEEVRSEIAETVEELSARLSPRQRAGAKVDQTKGLLHRVRHAPMIDSMLGVMYAPLFPLTEKIHVNRSKRRSYAPGHVLVPDGYTVEVVPAASTSRSTAASTATASPTSPSAATRSSRSLGW